MGYYRDVKIETFRDVAQHPGTRGVGFQGIQRQDHISYRLGLSLGTVIR